MCLDTVYFAENWKHCSKIILKRVNSAVWPIFNESFAKKRGFAGFVNTAQDPLEKHKSHRNTLLKKKKKITQTQMLAFSSVSKWVLNWTPILCHESI